MNSSKTTVIPLAPWIYAIDQQMVRSFVLTGSREAVCLDAGAFPADYNAMIGRITPLPLKLVLTHGDPDHTANLTQFPEVLVHQAELPLPDCPSSGQAVFSPITEGTILDLGSHRLRVLELPGHTPGSIGLLEEREGILFSGDTVSWGPVYMFGSRRNSGAYLKSLRRLQDMARQGAFSRIFPCHNTCPIGTDAIGHLISCMEGILNGTLSGVPCGLGRPGTENVLLYSDGPCGIYY